ncbi:polysaccharide biosynthesis tyrosine autokinase [Sinirhodobacter ferrireducens]|uniref:non-specific protein-tyrosine kinase n=2 Tax=Paenirhodobacter ferrireducens TaxID=1215032 RepID=A0A443L4X8_9RHOB|nr:polysaccharide biosynthesis tyrosine autokinase [Sinirhodobacter ferrireducens]
MNMNRIPMADVRADGGDDAIDLAQLVQSLRAGWRVIAAVTVLMIGLGLIYAYGLATPIYTAQSVVVLDTRKNQVVDLQGVMSGITGDSDELNTEVEVLRSRGLAEKVVDETNLAADPEFNTALRPPSLRARLKWLFGAQIQTETSKAGVVDALLDHLSVRNVPSSYVFEIAVQSQDPQKAAMIADAIAKRYILNQIEVKFDATEQATAWLTNRVAELKSDLEAAEEKVKSFNSATTLVSPEMLASLEVQLKDIRERIEQGKAQEVAAQTRVAALKAADTPEARLAAAQDAQLIRQEPGGAEFDARFAQVLARAELDAARATDQRSALERSQETLGRQIAKQGDDMIQLQQLTREAEASRTLYEYFLGRLKETSAQQGIQQADSRVLSMAVIPSIPTAPRKSLIIAMCVALGMFAGVGLVLVREALNSGFRTARQLEEETGVAVMGQIPVIPGKERAEILAYLASKTSSAAVEAVRNLRTSVLLSNVDHPPQVIVSTSSIPGEGKTTNSLALAMNLVGIGKSVLLIEGDIRRNTLGQYFSAQGQKTKGLVSVLSGEATLEEAILRPAELGISVIMGERSAINAADLFMSDAWHEFIRKARSLYDYIIIDTPPVLVVPDARIIAQVADAVLFSVKWNATSHGQVAEALQMFETVQQRVAGLILSQIDGEQMKRYGYGGKYGSYGAYSGYGAKYYKG